MKDYSWLSRPFDMRIKYSSSLLFEFLFILFLFEVIPVPIPAISESGKNIIRVILVLLICIAFLRGYRREKNRKHSLARGTGWSSLGTILGCLFSAFALHSWKLLTIAGGVAVVFVEELRTEWRERDLEEE